MEREKFISVLLQNNRHLVLIYATIAWWEWYFSIKYPLLVKKSEDFLCSLVASHVQQRLFQLRATF